MIRLLYLILLTLNVFCSNLYSQNTKTHSGLKNAINGYSYLKQQEQIIDVIKLKYPDLSKDLDVSVWMFNNKYKNAKGNLEKFILKQNVSLLDINKIILENYTSVHSSITNEYSTNFIKDLKLRAEGNMLSPYLETILFYNFICSPADEFMEGFKKELFANNKEKNINLKMKIPLSWNIRDADRPNIVKKAISENGLGNEQVLILIKKIPKEFEENNIRLSSIYNRDDIKIFSEDKNIIESYEIVIDGIDGYYFSYMSDKERFDNKVQILYYNYLFEYQNEMVLISFSLGYENELDQNYQTKDNFIKLFKIMINTLVFIDQYK